VASQHLKERKQRSPGTTERGGLGVTPSQNGIVKVTKKNQKSGRNAVRREKRDGWGKKTEAARHLRG